MDCVNCHDAVVQELLLVSLRGNLSLKPCFGILRPPSRAAPRLSDRASGSRVGSPLWGTEGAPGLFSLGAQTYRGSASGCRILPRY